MAKRETIELKPLFPEPALLIRSGSSRVLVVADLHVGWEIALSSRGIYVPSQSKRLFSRLLRIVKSSNPSTLILLGDVKHTVGRLGLIELRDLPELLETVKGLVDRVMIVPGNHDGDVEALTPEEVEITEPGGITLWNELGLFHGHAWPKPELFGCRTLVMGHIHPAVGFRDRFSRRFLRRAWVKAELDPGCLESYICKRAPFRRLRVAVRCERLLVMPSFNGFMVGRALNEMSGEDVGAISPILRSKCVDIDGAELYLLDGFYLGSLKTLRETAQPPLF